MLTFSTASLPGLLQAYEAASAYSTDFEKLFWQARPALLRKALADESTNARTVFLLSLAVKVFQGITLIDQADGESRDNGRAMLHDAMRELFRWAEIGGDREHAEKKTRDRWGGIYGATMLCPKSGFPCTAAITQCVNTDASC